MRNKFFFILILALSFGLSSASAQTPTPTPSKVLTIQGDVSREAKPADSSSTPPKSISGGVLNGKATSLPRPPYPAAARAVNASGAVNVQVTIDESGEIISANAVSGHPLLRQASEQAARASKFAPTLLQGQPVRVTGIIVYNFVLPMTLTQISYELSLAENSQSLKKFQTASIGGSFPKEWEEEKEALKKLDLYLIEKNLKGKNAQISVPANAAVDNSLPSTGVLTVSSSGSVNENYTLDSDSIAVINELQSKIENRLRADEKTLWAFKLGAVLGKLKAEIENGERLQANIASLNQLGAEVPAGIAESVVEKIKGIVESSQQNLSVSEMKEKITPFIENLRNVRIF